MKIIKRKRESWEMSIKILIVSVIIPVVVSCSGWLDVIPDNMPTVSDAFANRTSAEKSLFSCYSYLPNPTSLMGYPSYCTNRDEFEYGTMAEAISGFASQIARGEQNTNSPILNFWSGGNGAKSMYQAIRTCNLFLEEIYQPRDLDEYERNRWIAEVKFLKAYYHFFLLQLYGPIPIVKENLLLSATPDEVRVFREPIDECVAYITQLIDEAVPDLPLIIPNPVSEDGRITQPIALAVKAKALVWAASPLFNGNQSYQNWRDARGIQLVSDTYSVDKWTKAAVALRNAIDTCHLAGHELYRYNKLSAGQTINMNDSLVLIMNTRKGFTDKWNKGVVWASTAQFGGAIDNMQISLFPSINPGYQSTFEGACTASFNMTELFYSNNGVPIDEDVNWNYADRYTLRTSTEEAGNEHYIRLGEQTAAINFDRESRYYANLGFDRGYYELASTADQNGGASFNRYLELRNGEPGNTFVQNLTGYYPKKLIPFETGGLQAIVRYDYRFPLIRLADLYLLYSEALNEIKSAPDNEVYEWIDKVRDIVGLKGVVESWKNSRYPNRPSNKDDMRSIIHQERLIELAFEGQRFWDLRRWKMADKSRTYTPLGWNSRGSTAADYYTVTVQAARNVKFMNRDYLWPISNSDMMGNANLVQSYGW